MLQIKMKAWHYSCWTKTSTLWMCENTVSLFFSISAQGMAPSGMQLRTEKRYGGLWNRSSVHHWHKIKGGIIFTVLGTFTGSPPWRQVVLYIYAFRVKTRQDRILQNTHRFLGSCWEEPGHFRDPDWNGASVSMSACGASASVGAVSKTVTLVPVCWVNCWRLTCCSSSVAHSSSCSLSCNRLVSCPRDLSTALVMFFSLRLCWQNSAPSPCSAVCSLRELY